MPDYYLISEAYDEERTINPSHYNRDQPKPKPINLLLPSVHASRDHNILLADVASVEDPQTAVSALVDSCRDSCTWPSYGFSQDEAKDVLEHSRNLDEMQSSIKPNYYGSTKIEVKNAHMMHSQHNSPTAIAYSQYSQFPLGNPNYNASDPSVLVAARSLFFERKKQMALYGLPSPNPGWPQQRPQGPPELRMPSEYEMFTAWACLSSSEKQSYIHEVTNVSGGVGSSLEAGRAVRVLFKCCQDSWAWPSLQYLKAEESFIQRQLSHRPN